MQLTESVDTSSVSEDAPPKMRVSVIDAKFERRGIVGASAQARALGLGKSHWIRIRLGQVDPLSKLLYRIATYLETSMDSIYGRG